MIAGVKYFEFFLVWVAIEQLTVSVLMMYSSHASLVCYVIQLRWLKKNNQTPKCCTILGTSAKLNCIFIQLHLSMCFTRTYAQRLIDQ